ncbi:MAG: N(5)-hydroxyornithine transformylase PvdF [Cellvibrio sp. 79]|nr:MAG: N(5)-hydroxyornithine transformylase PvdF [Cellvibrio sp. 79]
MLNLVYIWSLRNAAADKAGRYIDYKGGRRYMASPLEYLVEQLNHSELGEMYSLVGIINDDDELSLRDREKLGDIGFAPEPGNPWLFPDGLRVKGRRVSDLLTSIPSSYRKLPLQSPDRISGKRAFELALKNKLTELKADLIVLDGLLVILDALIKPDSPFFKKIVNIHPGITRFESPYERRGAYATLDALYGAQGKKIIDWNSMDSIAVSPLLKTGASFHYVDSGIDSGDVITDVLNTDIDPSDTILELRWNNFNNSLFPALSDGLRIMAKNAVTPLRIAETI